MKDISSGLKYYNYIGSRKVKNLFKGLPYEVKLKNIKFTDQIRGCSGTIKNIETGKICYITTEFFFDGRAGSGLWRDPNKAIMMRTVKSEKDTTGGYNKFIPVSEIINTAHILTK